MSKKRLDELAIFGGGPAFRETLHVGRPNIGNRQLLTKYINDILDRRWLTNSGHYVREFEEEIAGLIGVKHCIAMCNGTVALEIAIRALGLMGEVILPSFTFIATAHALKWQGITPVFCDIDRESHNIDPGRVEALITQRTTGIIGVHIWGRPCDVEALAEIAQRRKLKLMYDAAHAFVCTHKGQRIGIFGDAEVFSFHATKILNTFEGGAIVTNDDDLARKIRLMKNFGFDGMDNVTYIGTNGKMNEVSAAMGLVSLESLGEFINVNQKHYNLYRTSLSGILGIHLLNYDQSERHNYQYIILEVDADKTGISRDRLMAILHAENVRVRRYFFPSCHRMEPYRSLYPSAGLLLPETEKLSECVLCLPTGSTVRPEDIQKICQIIGFAVEHGDEIRARLSSVTEK